VQLAVAGWLDGRLDEAERAFADGIAGRRAAGLPTWGAWASYELGQVQHAQGRLDAAARTCEQALEAAARTGQPPSPAAGPAYVGLAEVAYQRSELDSALDNAERGIALCRSFVYTMPLAAGLATLAWIRQAAGDPAGALDAMDEALRATPGPPPGLLNPIPARRARLLLAQGDLGAATRWTDENRLTEDDEPDYAREPGYLVLARVLLAQDRSGPALALLDRLYAAAAAQDRVGSLIEIGALRALALAARGDADRAVDALAGALTLACPQGYVRVFADEGPPMAALLARLIAAQRSGSGFGAVAEVPLGCLARLQRALAAPGVAPDAGRPSVTAAPGLIDPLTSRELEVLEMLAAGSSNQVIASQLVVTLDTVKKHVSHVLGKLGAANRTEAVARARELGLIP
jgi:LuxR family maltose regulon positive regulatory protein